MNQYSFPLPGGGIHIITANNKEEASKKHKAQMEKYAKRNGVKVYSDSWVWQLKNQRGVFRSRGK